MSERAWLVPTYAQFHGFRIMIFVDDHPPARVHAEGHGRHAAFLLGAAPGGVVLRGKSRLSSSKMAALRSFIEKKRDMPLQAWKELHGDK